uniref:Immunoglobulin V-set domain-containing protein n=1 Tax=Salarias fasciatus TaxID=181472 RepID=A0A672HBL8_SALFA
MDQKWIQILVILACCQGKINNISSESIIENGAEVTFQCSLQPGSLIVWFRVLEKSSMEFLVSVSNAGLVKVPSPSFTQSFSYSNNQLKLKSFDKERDSGIYNCATLKGNEMKFGKVTRLVGKPIKQTTVAPQLNVTVKTLPVTTPCACNDKKGEQPSSPSLDCAPLILGPLAGGCGLLLLLLVVTILYCNKIRTRRCPHHYKRK